MNVKRMETIQIPFSNFAARSNDLQQQAAVLLHLAVGNVNVGLLNA